MQNRDLLTLRTIAQTNSFREAAALLNMTPSAVSMQMKALETSLDAQLFDRRTRPPRLTALGRAVADAGQAVLTAETALRALTAPGATVKGRFRLGLVASAGPRLLPGFLRRYPAALPEVRFDLATGLSETLEARVAEGTLDAAVVTATGVPVGGLRHRVLAIDVLMAAWATGLPADAPFLQFAPGTGIGRLIAQALSERPDLAARPRVIVDHVETIRACLAASVGASILPEVDLASLHDITKVPLAATRALVLVTPGDGPLDMARDTLADLLLG